MLQRNSLSKHMTKKSTEIKLETDIYHPDIAIISSGTVPALQGTNCPDCDWWVHSSSSLKPYLYENLQLM